MLNANFINFVIKINDENRHYFGFSASLHFFTKLISPKRYFKTSKIAKSESCTNKKINFRGKKTNVIKK